MIDTVDADMLEPGDTISYKGEEIEILEEIEPSDDTRVSYRVHNLSTGMVEPQSFEYDERIDIVGVKTHGHADSSA